jgi:hypothetical protein
MREDYLFNIDRPLSKYLENKKLEVKREIYELKEDYILNVSEEDLAKALVEKYTFEPPKLMIDKIYSLEPKEIDVDVSQDPNRNILDRSRPPFRKGTLITIVIPFEGDEELFYYQPSTYYSGTLKGNIQENNLFLEYKITHHDAEALKKDIDHDIKWIQFHLKYVENDVNNYNNSLENYIKNLIKTRKDKLLQDRNLLSSLNIPIKKRSDAPWTYPILMKKKKINITLPQVKPEEFKPEPTLAMEIYEDILKILKNMSLVMERSPRVFSKMKEETLRDHFLVQLNGLYEGEAMGEVFNFLGKTDILIRHNNNNVFIAECKFWRGEKTFLETIDQLFKYITWRDTKIAILLFNKQGDLTKILEKIPKIIKNYHLYKRTINISNEAEFRFVLHIPNDTNREVILTVMVFDIPKI